MTSVSAILIPDTPLAVYPELAEGPNAAGASGLAEALSTAAALVAKQTPDTLIILTDCPTNDEQLHIMPGSTLPLPQALAPNAPAAASPDAPQNIACDTELAAALVDAARQADTPEAAALMPFSFDTRAQSGLDTALTTALSAFCTTTLPIKTTRVLRIAVSRNSAQKLWQAGALIDRVATKLNRRVAWAVCGVLGTSGNVQATRFATLVCDALRTGDFLPLLLCDLGLAEAAGQNVLSSLQLVVGAIGATAVDARLYARARLAPSANPTLAPSANPTEEYAVAGAFPLVERGMTPQRDYLGQWRLAQADLIRQARDAETEYCALARAASETWIAQGRSFMPPRTTSPLISGAHHGCEVRVYEFGALRGSSRHDEPTEQNLAIEICEAAHEAVTCGAVERHVRCEELKYLTYEVDVLS